MIRALRTGPLTTRIKAFRTGPLTARTPRIRAFRAELLKIRTTRIWWGLILGLAGWVGFGAVVSAAFAGVQPQAPSLDTPEGLRTVWSSAGGGGVFALVAGILGLTGEYRHQTVTSTFLATPRRGVVVAAKMGAYALAGLLYGLIACLTTLGLASLVISLRDFPLTLPGVNVPAILGGALLGTMLYAVVGVGVGALIRNQVAAVVGALIWVLLVEGLVVAFLPEVGKWLPGGAAEAMLAAYVPGGGLLPVWAGALLFAGYGLALAVLGTRVTIQRDVT